MPGTPDTSALPLALASPFCGVSSRAKGTSLLRPSSGKQARPCPPRPALLLLVHLGHSAAFWFNDTKPPTDLPHDSGSHGELSARSAIWQGHGLWITLAGGKLKSSLPSIISSLLLLPLLYHSLEWPL